MMHVLKLDLLARKKLKQFFEAGILVRQLFSTKFYFPIHQFLKKLSKLLSLDYLSTLSRENHNQRGSRVTDTRALGKKLFSVLESTGLFCKV